MFKWRRVPARINDIIGAMRFANINISLAGIGIVMGWFDLCQESSKIIQLLYYYVIWKNWDDKNAL